MANIPSTATQAQVSSEPIKVNYTPALISLAVLYFMMGFITCLNDTLVPFFKKGFNLNYSQSSLVQFYFFLTYGIMSIPAGKLVGRIGYKKGMVTGFGIAAIGAALFYPAAVVHQYYLFLAALFVLAIGIVLLQVAANPYITVLGPARTASSRLTLIQGIGSVGTTVAPIFGAYFILGQIQESASSDAVKSPYLGISLLLILIALAVLMLKLPVVSTSSDEQEKPADEPGSQQSALSFRNLRFGIAGIFFYVGAEVSIGTFLTNYIADLLKISEEAANAYVAFYWGGMIVGRFMGSLLLNYIKASKVLVFCALSAIAVIVLSLLTNGLVASWAMISVGLFNSIMFAVIFSLSVNGLGKHTTQASGLLSTAIAGGAVISYSQGLLIDHFSWKVAFALPIMCYLYIMFYGLSGYKIDK
ncbi:glucose/galactose MFS transporter [Pelobium manganitolerans]|uniref:Glucose/galactose MFS transporter n=1 Tax=Pelobium manganitolerans TaxID=1842495 RepID=A0A419S2F3_9SPHI|nr:sugar MFS transporter [Pelobium manganitolerans]RKD12792.1 glucose/galactose MFS transporter [Pelobium manganitolerans]